MYPNHVSHPEVEFRVGVFWGKIIYRTAELLQIKKMSQTSQISLKKKKKKKTKDKVEVVT